MLPRTDKGKAAAPEIHSQVTPEEIASVFEAEETATDLGHHGLEDWVTLAIFWGMALSVFLQFFTRYVLNNSFAWTEEIAINCLVAVVFLGSAMCVRLSRHIQVDVLYRFVPRSVGRALATLVDIVRIVFVGYAAVLVWRYSSIISDERMTTVDLPKSIVFYAVLAGFLLMFVRGIQVFIANLRRDYSVLERPEAFDGTRT